MNKISYTTMACPGWDARKAIESARKYGCHGVDLRLSDHLGEISESDSPGRLREIRRIAEDQGVIIPTVLCYNLRPSGCEDSWQAMEESIRHCSEIAALTGAHGLRILAGPDGGTESRAVYLRRLEESFRSVLDWGPPVNLLIQNHNKASLKARETCDLLYRLNDPRIGIAFCPHHCVDACEGPDKELMEALRPYCDLCYISDCRINRSPDGVIVSHETVLPGEGDLPLKETHSWLGGAAFDGWLTLKYEKIWEPQLSEPEVSIPAFVKFVQGLSGRDI